MNDTRWIKASMSSGMGACVELAVIGSGVAIRDSKNPVIELHCDALTVRNLVADAKIGLLDDLVRAEIG